MADHTHANEQFPMASHFPPDVNQKFLGALQVYPERRVYEGVTEDETVILLIRKHWITLLRPLFLGAVLALVPFMVLGLVLSLPIDEILVRYGIVFAWFSFAFVVYYFLSVFLRYMTDVWVVTDRRIIDMDANTIALKSAREVDLFAVAGVEQQRGGGIFFGGLNRGIIAIRIIGEEDYYIPQAPMPAEVAQVIREVAEMVQRSRIQPGGGMAAIRGGL